MMASLTQQPWSFTFEGTEEEVLLVEGELDEGALSCSRFEKEGCAGEVWVFEALFENNVLEMLGSDSFKSAYPKLDLFARERFECIQLPDKDWVAENRASFPPLMIGRFLIHGSHDVPRVLAGQIALEINASLAFGTGSHATTRGCLELLEMLKTPSFKAQPPHDLTSPAPSFQNILDLGCGTGLLAMAAARLFPDAAHIHASDNDQEAVNMTQENVEKNHLSRCIQTFLSEGFAAPLLQSRAYDLILANILAQPLITLAPDMLKYTASGAYLILSGLLQTQEAEVVDTYTQKGFSLLQVVRLGDWSALLLRRN